jgi:hypothetical protein
MRERGARREDVLRAIAVATSARASDDRWRLDGADTDGDALSVVCVLADGVVVVTVF